MTAKITNETHTETGYIFYYRYLKLTFRLNPNMNEITNVKIIIDYYFLCCIVTDVFRSD